MKTKNRTPKKSAKKPAAKRPVAKKPAAKKPAAKKPAQPPVKKQTTPDQELSRLILEVGLCRSREILQEMGEAV